MSAVYMRRGGRRYMKQRPECPVHGQMRMADVPPPRVLFTCAGWDGEGCDYEVDANDIPWQDIGAAEVTHQCPPEGGGGLMPCCGLTPFEVPPTDRITLNPSLVTCWSDLEVPA